MSQLDELIQYYKEKYVSGKEIDVNERITLALELKNEMDQAVLTISHETIRINNIITGLLEEARRKRAF